MDDQIESILEECLSQLRSGTMTVTDCQRHHPAVATELGPMLEMALRLGVIPNLPLSPEIKTEIENTILHSLPPKTPIP